VFIIPYDFAVVCSFCCHPPRICFSAFAVACSFGCCLFFCLSSRRDLLLSSPLPFGCHPSPKTEHLLLFFSYFPQS
jgi:hypothetical protein